MGARPKSLFRRLQRKSPGPARVQSPASGFFALFRSLSAPVSGLDSRTRASATLLSAFSALSKGFSVFFAGGLGLIVVAFGLSGCERAALPDIRLEGDSRPDRILIIEGGDSLLLEPGNEELNRAAVDNLLYAARHLEVYSLLEQVPEGLSAPRQLQYFRGKKCLLDYSLRFAQGQSFVVVPGHSRVGMVRLPAYPDSDLEKVFSARASTYSPLVLVDLRPSEVAFVEVEKAGRPAYRFMQDREGRLSWWIAVEDSVEGPSEQDMRLLLSYAAHLAIEKADRDSVAVLLPSDSVPLARLSIGGADGSRHRFEIYPFRKSPLEEAGLYTALVRYNEAPDLLRMNYIYLDVLMRDPSRYFGGLEGLQ